MPGVPVSKCLAYIFLHNVKALGIVFGTLLSALAPSVGALTLGDSHGTVVLGSSVDLAFDVRPDPGQDLEGACLEARVAAGNALIPDDRVAVTTSRAVASRVATVRVRSVVPLNEPVVSVTLTAGCAGQVSRTYTFLADLPSVPQAGSTPSAAALPPGRESVGAGASSAARESSVATEAVSGTPRGDTARGGRAPAAGRTRAVARQAAPSAEAAPASASKGGNEAGAALRLAREPMPMPAAAVDTTPEAALQAQARNAPEEAGTDRLRAQLGQEKAEDRALGQRAAWLESESFRGIVVYGLIALLLLALSTLAWVMRRAPRQEREERRQPVAPGEGSDPPSSADDPAAGTAMHDAANEHGAEALLGDEVAVAPAVASEDSLALAEAAQASEPVPNPALPPRPVVPPAALASDPLTQRIEHPEDLFDALQQAEFFISIGEHEQALGGLHKHIARYPDSSPLAYLELLRLYHTLGRVEGFEALRGQFHQYFNARVPPFAEFQHQGRTLEDYPEELAQIVAAWTSPEVMALLDGFMFHREGMDGVPPFDLPAYEDLLLLLAIVQTTSASQRGARRPRERGAAAPAGTHRVARALARSLDSMVGDLVLQPSAPVPLAGVGQVGSLDIDLTAPLAGARPGVVKPPRPG